MPLALAVRRRMETVSCALHPALTEAWKILGKGNPPLPGPAGEQRSLVSVGRSPSRRGGEGVDLGSGDPPARGPGGRARFYERSKSHALCWSPRPVCLVSECPPRDKAGGTRK